MFDFFSFQVPFKRFSFSTHDNRHAFQDQGEYFGNVSSAKDISNCHFAQFPLPYAQRCGEAKSPECIVFSFIFSIVF